MKRMLNRLLTAALGPGRRTTGRAGTSRPATIVSSSIAPDVRIADGSSVIQSRVASKALIGQGVVLTNCDLAEEVHLADGSSARASSIGFLTSIGRNTRIDHASIGSFCAIAWDSTVGATAHPHHRLTVSAFPYVPETGHFVTERRQSFERVTIGPDVWVGCHVVIMPGVAVGAGAVLGAGAIVTTDVPPYAIVAGVPARIVGYRFTQDVVEALLKAAWWEWDRDTITSNLDLFQRDLTTEMIPRIVSIQPHRRPGAQPADPQAPA